MSFNVAHPDQRQKVLSVTVNTAIDHILQIECLIPGETIRTPTDMIVPAGKGIDVSVGVATLGVRSVATGFVGHRSRDIFANLTNDGVEVLLLDVPGRTRTNITALERQTQRETHLQTNGYSISAADIQRLLNVLDQQLSVGDIAVIAGSLPPGAPAGLVSKLIAHSRARGADVIFDGSGCSLIERLQAQPHMIKPNLLELSQITDSQVDDCDEGIVLAARTCLDKGAGRVVASRGHRGIILVEQQRAFKASVDIGRHQQTASVGSGDALVAGFAVGTIQGLPIEQTLRLAVACASANLFTELPGRFHLDDVEKLLPYINVEELRSSSARSAAAHQ